MIIEANGKILCGSYAATPLSDEHRDPDHVRMYAFDGPGTGRGAFAITTEIASVIVSAMDRAHRAGRHEVQTAIRNALGI